jgi:hypothetical protein
LKNNFLPELIKGKVAGVKSNKPGYEDVRQRLATEYLKADFQDYTLSINLTDAIKPQNFLYLIQDY